MKKEMLKKIRHKKIEKNIEIEEQGQMEWNRKWNRRDKKQKNVKKTQNLNWCFSTPELAKKKNLTTPSISEDVEQWELY